MQSRSYLLALTLVAGAVPAQAADYLLDFSGDICGVAGDSPCSNFSELGANYGDVAGVLDVSARSITTSTGLTFESYLKYWSTSYSDLVGVAWGGANQTGYMSEFTFTPAAGQVVTVNSFDFGDYLNRNFGSQVAIYAADGTTLLWNGGAFDPGATAISFAPAISSTSSLVLRWGPDGYDIGIDNISLSVTAVPEPATAALWLAGMGVFAAALRRRRS